MKNTATNRGAAIAVALIGAATAISLWSAPGCESTNPITQSRQIIFPDTGVLYHVHVQPLFDLTCTYSGCHDDVSRAGGLSLTNWSNANADPGNIIPGDPNHSKLVQVMEGTFLHATGRPDTIENHAKGIRQWVLEGAKNN